MLTRTGGNLRPRTEPAPEQSRQLQDQGFVHLAKVLADDEREALKAEIEALYDRLPPDARNAVRPLDEDEDFRYEMLNRSERCQTVIGHPRILEVIEPLLGEDCHVIANTCWRNPPRDINTHGGGAWHIDAGPHLPRDASIPWDERIPYPVFAIGVHIFLDPCPMASGPTGVIPGSHKSGRYPPRGRPFDVDLTCDGKSAVPLPAEAGDAIAFVSDVWHRRMPSQVGDSGRFFLQVHYGRRDLAQRLRTTADVNQLSDQARARARTPRQRTLVGLHDPFFYDG